MFASSHSIVRITLEEWHAFAATFEDRHVFHHRGWIESLQKTYHFPLRIYAVTDNNTGSILAALPFMQVLTLRGKRKWICLPFTDFFPVLGDIVLTVALVRYLHETKTLKGQIEVRCELPAEKGFHYSVGQVTHSIDLQVNPDALFDRIAKNHRKALRQGTTRGISVEIVSSESAIEQFYELHLRTRREKGLPTQPKKFFLHLYSQLMAGDENGRVFLARNKFTVIGGKVVLYWGEILTGKFSASDYAYLSFRPNHSVYWNSILWAIEEGFSVYDLGKTTLQNDGLGRFKEGWTAVEKPLLYTYLGVAHDVEIDDPADSGLMKFVSRVIQWSPLFASRVLGALFYRFFA